MNNFLFLISTIDKQLKPDIMDRLKDSETIKKISKTVETTCNIDNELFKTFNVKRGLRNEDHTGVVVGLTKVGDVEIGRAHV